MVEQMCITQEALGSVPSTAHHITQAMSTLQMDKGLRLKRGLSA